MRSESMQSIVERKNSRSICLACGWTPKGCSMSKVGDYLFLAQGFFASVAQVHQRHFGIAGQPLPANISAQELS